MAPNVSKFGLELEDLSWVENLIVTLHPFFALLRHMKSTPQKKLIALDFIMFPTKTLKHMGITQQVLAMKLSASRLRPVVKELLYEKQALKFFSHHSPSKTQRFNANKFSIVTITIVIVDAKSNVWTGQSVLKYKICLLLHIFISWINYLLAWSVQTFEFVMTIVIFSCEPQFYEVIFRSQMYSSNVKSLVVMNFHFMKFSVP